jgi:hypothetical protein
MTQTPNASHTSLSSGRESLAKETSKRKQAGRQDTSIRHVGLRATNPAAAEFYRDVLGMEITGGSTPDHPLGSSGTPRVQKPWFAVTMIRGVQYERNWLCTNAPHLDVKLTIRKLR